MNMIWMSHPSLPGQEINVPESAMTIHAHSGWLLMDGPPEPKPAPEVARADVHGEPYDQPSDSENDAPKPPPSEPPAADEKTTGAKRSTRSASSTKGSDS